MRDILSDEHLTRWLEFCAQDNKHPNEQVVGKVTKTCRVFEK